MLRAAPRLLLVASLLATSVPAQTPPANQSLAVAAAPPPQNIHTGDDPELLRETQLGVDVNSRTGLVWWVPFDFWVISGEKNGTSPDRVRKNLAALRDYTIVGSFVAKVSSLGSFDYITPEELQKKTFIRDSAGQEYAAVEVKGDAKNLADIIKPMLTNAMGRAGENFVMMFFPARRKDGQPIVDASAKGQFSVVLKDVTGEPETIFLWRTPLTSISPPRYCPVGKERVHADWDYCPWHGVKLTDKP